MGYRKADPRRDNDREENEEKEAPAERLRRQTNQAKRRKNSAQNGKRSSEISEKVFPIHKEKVRAGREVRPEFACKETFAKSF